MGVGLNLTPKQAQGLTKSIKKLNKADAIQMASEIVGAIAVPLVNSIYAVKNEKLRQSIVAELDKLNAEQLSELTESQSKIEDSDARFEAFMYFFSKSVSAQKSKELSDAIKKEKLGKVMSDRKMIYISIGVTLALFLTIIVVKRITK